jgi:diguanylate cyclase (GGDEF)-like protein
VGGVDDPDWDSGKTLGSTTLTDIRLPLADAERREGTLLVIAGTSADLGAHLVVRGEAVVGRDLGELRLRDGRVSRKHVRVWAEDGRYFVEDLGSTNGSLLNGRALERPSPLGDGDRIYLGGTVLKFGLVDETEARYLERMERLAGTDPLTGLHAKHRYDSMAEEALRQARLAREPFGLLMMDMDGLKSINDRHGHRMGAHTIATVGKAIGEVLRGRGEACRFGGDEFCAYLPKLKAARCRLVAEEIRLVVEDGTYELDGASVSPTISIGLAMLDPGTKSLGGLVARADEALYRAKAAGRNCVSD